MSRPIPEVRASMLKLAERISSASVMTFPALKRQWAQELRRLADDTKRKPPISVARKRIAPLTDGQKEALRAEHRARPHLSQLELAIIFNTNPGRISEALNEGRDNA